MTERLTETKTWEEIVEKILTTCQETENKNFRKWLMTKKDKNTYWFSELMWLQCYKIYKKINSKTQVKDHFIVIDGNEGVGKSTLANQIAYVVDPSFDLERVCYQPIHFFKNLRIRKPGQAISIDEGALFLYSREAMSKNNRGIVKTIQQMRWRQLLTIVCIPSIMNLETDIRKRRVDQLIHIIKNGTYAYFFSKKPINQLVADVRKRNLLTIDGATWPAQSYFYGHNINENPIKDYMKCKEDNWDAWLDECMAEEKEEEAQTKYLTVNAATKILPLGRKTLIKMIQEKELVGKKIREKWFVERESLMKACP